MAYDKGNRPEGGFKRRGGGRRRKKVCVFCGKENNEIDYKDTAKLRKYIRKQNIYFVLFNILQCLFSICRLHDF